MANSPAAPTRPERTRTPTTKVTGAVETRLAMVQEQLNELRSQVRQAQQLSVLGTSAATLAHEVNNLLTPIMAYAIAAQEGDDVELMRKALEVTAKNVNILMSMSGHILEVGAAKATEAKEIHVRPVVHDAVASLCRDPSKDGIRLRIQVEDDLVALVDPLQLQQVLFNLLLNAREAMAPARSGLLRISAQQLGSRVAIEVYNTGECIPKEQLERIFEPFQSGKSNLRNGKYRCGGLGLALCRDLIESNGGSITVSSNAQDGTAFRIDLPSGNTAPEGVQE